VIQTKNDFLLKAPLPDAEVVAIAQSAWRYEQEGHNWSGRSPRTLLTRRELLYFSPHKYGGDALILWSYLEGQHAAGGASFAIDREAMAAAQTLPRWTTWRYRQAIKALLELGLLEFVRGGHRRSNQTFAPYQYRLKRPVAGGRQNTTKTGVGGSASSDEVEP
jgi:hypothetical protein